MKTFRVTETSSVQFRAEIFNVANQPKFALPVADVGPRTPAAYFRQDRLG